MLRLLQIEAIKLVNFRTTWVILFLYLGVYFLAMRMAMNWMFPSPAFNEVNEAVWMGSSMVQSIVTLFLGALVIASTTHDRTHKVLRQHLADGMSRNQYFYTKGLVVVLMVAVALLSVALFSFFFMFKAADLQSDAINLIKQQDLSDAGASKAIYYSVWEMLGLRLVSNLGICSMALFFGILFRGQALAIVLFLSWFVVEGIFTVFIAWVFQANIEQAFLPGRVFFQLLPFRPAFEELKGNSEPLLVGLALLYTMVFVGASYFLLKRRDA